MSTRFVGPGVVGLTAILGVAALLLIGLAGCASSDPEREMRMARSYIYYLDGAGGAGMVTNWSGGVRRGLVNAGYAGSGEVFKWQTGLGVAADQTASEQYKRDKARKLADSIRKYRAEHPDPPVYLMGLSAGTAVAAFALEELPLYCTVENVVMVGASISADYDLTEALKRVNDRLYVFTSEKDPVLGFLVPMAGTADRSTGPSAGLRGFDRPASASAETRRQYAKIVQVAWRPEFAEKGYHGGHTDVVNPRFVEAYIAPLLMATSVHERALAAVPPGKVRNPAYANWIGYGPGSWAQYEGYQVTGGKRQSLRVIARLRGESADRLAIEHEFYLLDEDVVNPDRTHQFYAAQWVDPKEYPTTHPAARSVALPDQQIVVAGRSFTGKGTRFMVPADFAEWGANLDAEMYLSSDAPGGIVKLDLKSSLEGKPFEVHVALVRFHGEAD